MLGNINLLNQALAKFFRSKSTAVCLASRFNGNIAAIYQVCNPAIGHKIIWAYLSVSNVSSFIPISLALEKYYAVKRHPHQNSACFATFSDSSLSPPCSKTFRNRSSLAFPFHSRDAIARRQNWVNKINY